MHLGSKEELVIFNLNQLLEIDSLGTKAILQALPPGSTVSVLWSRPMIHEALTDLMGDRRIKFLRNEQELITKFSKDLVHGKPDHELRSYARLQVALPIELSNEDHDSRAKYSAVVTNLSESGFFAEYIDLKEGDEAERLVNQFDLNEVVFKLWLPDGKKVNGMGHVVQQRVVGEQVG